VFASPGTWWIADGFPKGSGKVALIGEAAFDRDVGEALARIHETALRRFDALPDQVLMRWHTRRLPKSTRDVLGGEAGQFRQILQANVLGKMLSEEVANAT
jgi:hypothetical protein